MKPHPFITIATQAARNAAHLILRQIDRQEDITLYRKPDGSIVSSIDQEAEQEILQIIQKAYPDHAILSEESGSQGDNRIVWIVDPLDGTLNFVHGFPHFCISIAVQVDARLEHAVIYDPLRNELFSASRGQGALRDNRRLRVEEPGTHGWLVGAHHMEEAVLHACNAMGASLRRTGSAALDLAYLASGRLHLFLDHPAHLQIWDLAAGILIAREAGALVSTVEGTPYEFGTSQSLLIASPKLHAQWVAWFQQNHPPV